MAFTPSGMYFDVWPGDDLLGTATGELTQASNRSIRAVDNGMGRGDFTINRHDSQYAWITPGPSTREPLIRVRRDSGGPFAYDDARYVFAFFVEEGDDTLVSTDEEGGEEVQRGGRSAEAILGRAIIDFEAHYVDDIVDHPYDKTAVFDGQWHIDHSVVGSTGALGRVLRIFLRNAGAMSPEPMPELTHDFSVDVDSSGDAWPHGEADWTFDVGNDLLSVLGILVGSGLYYRINPALLLQAWEYASHPGSDLSASITFKAADSDTDPDANIATAATKTIHGSTSHSRLLVRGTAVGGRFTYRWVADTGIESVLGVRQGYGEYLATPSPSRLDLFGQKLLTDGKDQHDGVPTIGVAERTGEVAFVDYRPGDIVSVSMPEVEGTPRIFAITLAETDTGEVNPTIEFTGEAWQGLFVVEPGPATKGGCCGEDLPPFVCDPVDFEVPAGSGPLTCVVAHGDTACTSTNGVGVGTLLKAGATYRIQYTVFHSADSGQFLAKLSTLPFLTGVVAAEIVMGGSASAGIPAHHPGSPPAITFAETTYTAPSDDYYKAWLDGEGGVGLDSEDSSISVRIFYLSGPDPRFEGLAPCTNGTPTPAQRVEEPVRAGDGTSTSYTTIPPLPYTAASLRVEVAGVDWTRAVTETDPTTGEYALAYAPPSGATISVEYVAGLP